MNKILGFKGMAIELTTNFETGVIYTDGVGQVQLCLLYIDLSH